MLASDTLTNSNFAQQDFKEVMVASLRLARDERAPLSSTEYAAAAFVNGRLDLLPGGILNFRQDLITMGSQYAHAAIAAIFLHSHLETTLPPSDPRCPVKDQRIFFPR